MNLPITPPAPSSGMNAIAAIPSARIVGEERREGSVAGDVGDHNRFGAFAARRPRRVPLDRSAVGLGQTSPRLESHDVVGIEEQNRGPLEVQPRRERVQRGVIDFIQPLGAADRNRELQTDAEWRSHKGEQGYFSPVFVLDGMQSLAHPPARSPGRHARLGSHKRSDAREPFPIRMGDARRLEPELIGSSAAWM